MTALEIHIERVDDIPLLMAQQEKMGIPQVLDQIIHSHGNRQGLSIGQVVQIWLSYILSEGDHRMMVVEEWVSSKLTLLSALVGEAVNAKDFTDDRLADVLKALSDEETWEQIEAQLGQHLIRVYRLENAPIRLDSTSVCGHHEVAGGGLFQYGYSKDHRPDLAQFKVMLATLDPLGMPLVSWMPSGEERDDGLYIPTLRRSQAIVGKGGHLYVGDSKLSSRQNRAFIAGSGDYYLTTLPRRQRGDDEIGQWLKPILEGQQLVTAIPVVDEKRNSELIWALGYETSREQQGTADDLTTPFTWQERVLVVFRPVLAKQERHLLERNLEKAKRDLQNLVPKRAQVEPRWTSLAALEAAAQQILKAYRVEGLLKVACERHEGERVVRAYGDRPARTEIRVRDVIHIQRNAQAIRQTRQKLGWRLYVTNAPAEQISFEKLVLTYRDAPRIELDFRRLKGCPLGLRPVYTHRDDHTLGLARLLTLALRVLTLTEFVVREQLQRQAKSLPGLYPGQPQRRTSRPTTERLLQVFKGIDLCLIEVGDHYLWHITPLSPLQYHLLGLLGLPAALYENLTAPEASFPP